MNPHTKIISIKAATPPQSGDRYQHRTYGLVRLIRPAGGDSWHCAVDEMTPGCRLILRPSKMQRIHSTDAAP